MARYLQLFSVLIISLINSTSANTQDIGLILEPEKTKYILQEPVKFYLSFHNNTDSYICIFDYTRSGFEAETVQIEVTYPSGKVERRAWLGMTSGFYGIPYQGIPFSPEDTLQFCFYPNGTQVWEGRKYSSNRTPTFSEVGTYKIRYVFWTPDEKTIYSNSLSIDVVLATADQKEILDAYWKESIGGHQISYASCFCCNDYDRDALKTVIEKYPYNDMIKYAMFGYAISLGCGREGRNELAGIRVLDDLSEFAADFYYYETNLLRTRFLVLSKQTEEARKLYRYLLKRNPNLVNRHNIIAYIGWVESGSVELDNPYIRRENEISVEWREMVRAGKWNEFVEKYTKD